MPALSSLSTESFGQTSLDWILLVGRMCIYNPVLGMFLAITLVVGPMYGRVTLPLGLLVLSLEWLGWGLEGLTVVATFHTEHV